MVKPKMSQVDLRGVVPGEFLYPEAGKPAQGCASGLGNAIVQRIDLLTCGVGEGIHWLPRSGWYY